MPHNTTLELLKDARAKVYCRADAWQGRDPQEHGRLIWLAHTFDHPIMRMQGTWRPGPMVTRRPSGRPIARSHAEALTMLEQHFSFRGGRS